MKLVNSSKLVVNKSKFFGYLFKIDSKKDIEEAIDFVKEENKKSTHVCFGFVFNEEKGFRNDSEVGNPGKILLGLLEINDFHRHCLVVSRIFGGVKLGSSKVGKVFRETGEKCIQENALI